MLKEGQIKKGNHTLYLLCLLSFSIPFSMLDFYAHFKTSISILIFFSYLSSPPLFLIKN